MRLRRMVCRCRVAFDGAGAAVAMHVRGSKIPGAIVGVVEVPCLSRQYGLSATAARYGLVVGYALRPARAQPLVSCAVATVPSWCPDGHAWSPRGGDGVWCPSGSGLTLCVAGLWRGRMGVVRPGKGRGKPDRTIVRRHGDGKGRLPVGGEEKIPTGKNKARPKPGLVLST